MKLPFLKYIQGLILSREPYESVISKIGRLSVPLSKDITEQMILDMYGALAKSAGTYLTAMHELPDIEMLRRFKVVKMVAKHFNLEIEEGFAGLEGANNIVYDKEMYLIVTALAMAKVTDEDIELIVNGKYNIHYSKDDIKEFLHYYFNISSWSLQEKKQYLNYITDPKLLKAYKLAIEGDKDYLLWKLGIAPEKSFDSMLHDMMTDSYYFFKEKAQDSPEEAQKWGALALKITDKIEQIEDDRSSKRSLFEEIQFVIDSGGKHRLSEPFVEANVTASKFKHISELAND